MFPFTVVLMRIAKEKLIKHLNIKNIILKCTQVAFLLSVCIEFLQLFLRLGTFQLSDIFYNTFGGCLGGMVYGVWGVLETEKAFVNIRNYILLYNSYS